MSMTKRHFQEVADILRSELDGQAIDSDGFYAACGVKVTNSGVWIRI